MSLFTEWVGLYTSHGDAIKTINRDLLEKYNKDVFSDWHLRKVPIPERVKKYMRKQAIPVVAKEHGVSPEVVKKILESLL